MIRKDSKDILKSVRRLAFLMTALLLLVTTTAIGCGDGENDVLVVVPNLRSLNKDTANKILDDRDLKLQVIEEKNSENLPEDSIISQIPDPGEIIKSSRAISVVLSKGRGKVEMPRLIGMDFRTAKKEINKRSLKLGSVNEVESFHNPVGTVEKQFPAEGTKIGKYSPVTLTVSIGSYIVMPDLIDLSIDEAVSLIGKSGFNGDRIRHIPISEVDEPNAYNNIPSGFVVRQDPEAGMQVDSENPIDIYFKP